MKKSAEAPQPPLKFAKLLLLPSVGALGHAEFRSFRIRDLRDTDFFKAGDLWIREVRRSSNLGAQLYTVGPHGNRGPPAIASTQGGLSLSLPPRVRASPTDGLGRFGPSAQLHDGARPMGLRSASPCPNFSYVRCRNLSTRGSSFFASARPVSSRFYGSTLAREPATSLIRETSFLSQAQHPGGVLGFSYGLFWSMGFVAHVVTRAVA